MLPPQCLMMQHACNEVGDTQRVSFPQLGAPEHAGVAGQNDLVDAELQAAVCHNDAV